MVTACDFLYLGRQLWVIRPQHVCKCIIINPHYITTLHVFFWPAGNPSSAQLQPTEAVTTPQNVHYQEQPNRLQLERLHLPSNDGSADERLLESPTHEWEAFRQRQSSDPERLSSYSSSSELTETTLVPTQPSLSTNATEHTMYESAVMLQQYPERDIGPYSPVASCNMWQESNVTNTRRQTDREMQADVSHDDFSHNTSKVCSYSYLHACNGSLNIVGMCRHELYSKQCVCLIH